MAIELAFARTLVGKMAPCDNAAFFFQVLDNDRAANQRMHKPFTTTLLPSVAQSVATKYLDKMSAEQQDRERMDQADKLRQERQVAEWRRRYLDPQTPPEERAFYRNSLIEAGEPVPDQGRHA
jgi:hypothetical protein